MALTPREEFKRYCLFNLGKPLLNLSIDDDQIEDRINEAIQYYQEFHVNGSERAFFVYPNVTQTDIDNNYITVPDSITAVVKVLNFQDTLYTSSYIFDMKFQMRVNQLWDFSSASFSNYITTLQHLRTLEILFSGEVQFNFYEHTNRLNIHWGWGKSECPLGMFIVSEVYRKLDPEEFTNIYKDRWLRKYATALIKRMWGQNLSLYDNVTLVGGVTLRGGKILSEANAEIAELENQCLTQYSAPISFYSN
jgi:hypothetical protein